MSFPILACLAVLVAGLSLTLYADFRQYKVLETIGKPLAALAFIVAGLLWGGLESAYGRWILAGLIFGALGDVLLIPNGTGRVFLGGMLSFALGHLFYAIGFLSLPQSTIGLGLATVTMTVFSLGILRWLLPHVQADFKGPVLAYVAVIGFMVVSAVGASTGGSSSLIAIAAIGFAGSDLAVARHRFVQPGFVNRAWGLPLYFLSQFGIAATIALAS